MSGEIYNKAGFIEGWGRGTIEIVNQCLKQELPEPDFIEEYGVFKTVLYKSKWNEETLKKMGLNERQIKAVLYGHDIRDRQKISLPPVKVVHSIYAKRAVKQ